MGSETCCGFRNMLEVALDCNIQVAARRLHAVATPVKAMDALQDRLRFAFLQRHAASELAAQLPRLRRTWPRTSRNRCSFCYTPRVAATQLESSPAT